MKMPPPHSVTYVGFAAFIFTIAVCLLSSCSDTPSDGKDSNSWKVIRTVTAPNGEYVATIYTVMGGGAAGWCSQRLEIHATNNPFSIERAKQGSEYCFSASCGSEIEVLWDSHSQSIQIKYTIGAGGVSTYQRRMAPNLPVRIDYIAQ
jgi:hypothetical protein